MSIITITVKCDLDNDEIFGRVHVQTTADRTLDWLLGEFCTEKRVKRKSTFALRSATNPELELGQTIAQSGLADGETIFAYNKNPPPPPPDLPKVPPPSLSTWWILAACALALGATGLIAVVVTHVMLSRPAEAFGIVVDAGAATSKALVYGWRASKYHGNGVVAQKAAANTVAPIETPGGVEQVRAAVAAVKPAVPANLEVKTRLYLGATAGMRMYREANASRAEAVLDDARRALRSGGLRFDLGNTTATVRILAGDEEARAGWVAVNYLKGSFGDVAAYEDGAPEPPTPPLESTKTVGSLDLGGGSAQVAFAAPAGAPADAPDTQPVTVYGQTRRVYAHSFLCYGKGAAERRALGRAIADAGYDSGKPVEFPCWQRGYSDEVLGSDVFVPPCPIGLFTVPPGKLGAKFLITGSGDSSRCRLLVARFFGSACDKPSCSFNNVYQPDPTGRFVAFAGFYYVASFFNLTASGQDRGSANLTEVSILVDSFCSRPYQAVAGIEERYLRWHCFGGIYIESLLRALGFNDSNWGNIEFVDKITSHRKQGRLVVTTANTISWPLGHMILQSALATPEGLILAMPLPLFIFLVVLFILLLALSVAFACMAKRSGAGKKKGYNPF